MREMTGIEVTATAIPITSSRDVRFDRSPMNQPSGSRDARPSMMKNGRTVPTEANQAIWRRSCFWKSVLVSAPERNIRSSKPNW